MRIVVFFIFITLNLVASDILSVSLAKLEGKSIYEVWQNSTALKSKLIFPVKATLLNLRYQKNINTISSLALNYKTKINSYDSLGEDYDMKDSKVTVYSHSKNKIDYYDEVTLESIFQTQLFAYNFSVVYKRVRFYWTDTFQSDFIKNKEYKVLDKSVEYSQDFLLFSFSPRYTYTLSALELWMAPSVFYGINFSTDNHIKREFYTKSIYKNIGFKSNIGIKYDISSRLSLTLSHDYFSFHNNNSKMDYFDDNFKYLTLSSSINYYENGINLGLFYIF